MKKNYFILIIILILWSCGSKTESIQEDAANEDPPAPEAAVATQLTVKELFVLMPDSISMIPKEARVDLSDKGAHYGNEFEYSLSAKDGMITINAGNMDKEYVYEYVLLNSTDAGQLIGVLKRSTGYCGGDCPDGKATTLQFGLFRISGESWSRVTHSVFPDYNSEMVSGTSLTSDMIRTTSRDEMVTEWRWNGSVFEQANKYPSIASVMDELSGIEKYYVRNDLRKLHGLLKFKKDDRLSNYSSQLEKLDESAGSVLNVTLLDAPNGYIEYSESMNECDEAMVYWNKTNGEKLIGHVTNCCTMFCDGSIDFKLYQPDSKSYTRVNGGDIVEGLDLVKSLRPEGHIEGDGYDSEYILPQKGKNIRYCVGEDRCLDLIWQDGTFVVSDN
ncbi:hypothetical protein [Marinoscillum sp.]|uniref:hypothetical protein n=1 Tax=Marinoscillum sp. TaxID=2024838 RepID=UPI003BA98F55